MLKTIKFGLVVTLILFGINVNAQSESSKSEIEEITETLMNYIDGTANGEIDKLRKAFHPDFNLYSVTKEDSLRVWKERNILEELSKEKSLIELDE